MNEKIYVWDPLLRLFHWALVVAFTFSYFSGEEETVWHTYSGYTILGLLVFRLIWGFIGSKYARFSSLILSPAAAIAYLRGLLGNKPVQYYPGHNPAGSWMVVALLLSLAITVFSGLKHYGEEGYGPLAKQYSIEWIATAYAHGNKHEGIDDEDGEEEEELWMEIHEFFANLTLLLVLLHIAGVLLSSRKHGENLARAMITGYKQK